MRYVNLVIVLVYLTQGCNNNRCSNDPPPIAPVTFYLTDQTGKNLIDREQSLFHPDSIQILLNDQSFPFDKEYDQSLKGYKFMIYPGTTSKPGDLFFIYLNRSDTDSLEVLYRVRQGECFPIIEYSAFFYNRREIYPNNQPNLLRLIKL